MSGQFFCVRLAAGGRRLLLSCYIRPQGFPSGSSPFVELPALERAPGQPWLAQHPLI